MSYIAPNKRGVADRSSDRNTRYGTHTPVLIACISALSSSVTEITVIEHGMGLHSTKLFHTFPCITKIISLEQQQEWLKCEWCNSDQKHVMLLTNDDNAIQQATLSVNEPDKTLGFVDGDGTQRKQVLTSWMNASVVVIVEHDAETFSLQEVDDRQRLSSQFGYKVFQYVGQVPETLYYVKDSAVIPTLEDVLAW